MNLKKTIFIYDTSALLGGAYQDLKENTIDQTYHYISSIVFDELEHIKTSSTKTEEVKYKARSLVRNLMKNRGWFNKNYSKRRLERILKFKKFPVIKNDSLIMAEAFLLSKKYNVIFVTQDSCQFLLMKTNFPKIELLFYDEYAHKESLWSGYKNILAPIETLENIYREPTNNVFKLDINEYAYIENQNELMKWDGQQYQSLHYKNIKTDYFGEICPLNIQQEFYFDLLQNRNVPVKLCRGPYGTGKSFLAFIHALYYIRTGKFDKIIYIRNNIEVSGSKPIGALPGDTNEKLLEYVMPIADILGSKEVLLQYIDDGIIVPVHTGFLRGRSFDKSIIFVDEAENLTSSMIKLIIGRVGKNSEIWVLGDESQADSEIFKKNSGIAALSNSLKGNTKFGTVELLKQERSDIAQLCELIKN